MRLYFLTSHKNCYIPHGTHEDGPYLAKTPYTLGWAAVAPHARKIILHFYLFFQEVDMTKAELIEQMAKDAGISKAAAGEALASFMGSVAKALKKRNGKVTLVGFGTFKKVYRKTRKGRNPQTGAPIKIKAKNVVKFKAVKGLKAAI